MSGQKEGSVLTVDIEIEGQQIQLLNGGPHFKLNPSSSIYVWCTDRYGLSWQLMIGEGPAKVAPALLFTGKAFGKAEKAVSFYLSHFKNSKLEFMHKDPTTNAVLHSVFKLDGVPFVLMEGPAKGKDDMEINGAMSFVVNCKDQNEIDKYFESMMAAMLEMGKLDINALKTAFEKG